MTFHSPRTSLISTRCSSLEPVTFFSPPAIGPAKIGFLAQSRSRIFLSTFLFLFFQSTLIPLNPLGLKVPISFSSSAIVVPGEDRNSSVTSDRRALILLQLSIRCLGPQVVLMLCTAEDHSSNKKAVVLGKPVYTFIECVNPHKQWIKTVSY